MRKYSLLLAAVSISVFMACNSNSDQSIDSATDTTSKSADTSHGNMDMTSNVEPLPDIPAGAKVYFKNLKNGETVSSPVKVEMGTENIKVDSAGKVRQASGHHHLLIDAAAIEAGQVVPKDSTHLHFGNAQMQTEVPLKPGKHTLTLQFADGLHRSYGDKLSSTITVTVRK